MLVSKCLQTFNAFSPVKVQAGMNEDGANSNGNFIL